MDFWEALLVVVGGNAALLLAVAWLTKSFASQLLTKDLERFKGELATASALSVEKLKHELQLAALEHQVRFSKYHERRAEVVAELSSLLVEAHWACASFASAMEWTGEPSKQEKYSTAVDKSAEFYRYFDKSRLYLPVAICTQLEDFVRKMRREVIGFGVHVSKDEKFLPDHALEAKHKAWMNAATYFDDEFPKARAALEQELRTIIGGGT